MFPSCCCFLGSKRDKTRRRTDSPLVQCVLNVVSSSYLCCVRVLNRTCTSQCLCQLQCRGGLVCFQLCLAQVGGELMAARRLCENPLICRRTAHEIFIFYKRIRVRESITPCKQRRNNLQKICTRKDIFRGGFRLFIYTSPSVGFSQSVLHVKLSLSI